MLEVQKYLLEGNPLVTLAGPPWNLFIKEEGNLVLLKYNQLESDFSEPICKECRGLILYKPTWEVVCFPFFKFFNYREPYADSIDEKELHIYQKIDGSLAKVWYFEGVWRLSSNGIIDASEVNFTNGVNFQSLFMRALSTYGLDWSTFVSSLDKEYTYMYELATPDNKIVVPYEDYQLFYLGQRNNKTFIEEYKPDKRIDNVKVFHFNSIQEIIAAANELPDSEEGYVVCDKNWNRVKIKNPIYFILHKTANNGKPDLVQYVLERNEDELLAYFPEYKEEIEKIKATFRLLERKAHTYVHIMERYYELSRLEFAECVFRGGVPVYFQTYVFKTYKNHMLTWREYTKDWDIYAWKRLLEQSKKDLI